MAKDELDLHILLKLQHLLTDVALRDARGQQLVGQPAAFGLPEFDRVRTMTPAEFAGAALDIGNSRFPEGKAITLPS